jgi:hypothetical protein
VFTQIFSDITGRWAQRVSGARLAESFMALVHAVSSVWADVVSGILYAEVGRLYSVPSRADSAIRVNESFADNLCGAMFSKFPLNIVGLWALYVERCIGATSYFFGPCTYSHTVPALTPCLQISLQNVAAVAAEYYANGVGFFMHTGSLCAGGGSSGDTVTAANAAGHLWLFSGSERFAYTVGGLFIAQVSLRWEVAATFYTFCREFVVLRGYSLLTQRQAQPAAAHSDVLSATVCSWIGHYMFSYCGGPVRAGLLNATTLLTVPTNYTFFLQLAHARLINDATSNTKSFSGFGVLPAVSEVLLDVVSTPRVGRVCVNLVDLFSAISLTLENSYSDVRTLSGQFCNPVDYVGLFLDSGVLPKLQLRDNAGCSSSLSEIRLFLQQYYYVLGSYDYLNDWRELKLDREL